MEALMEMSGLSDLSAKSIASVVRYLGEARQHGSDFRICYLRRFIEAVAGYLELKVEIRVIRHDDLKIDVESSHASGVERQWTDRRDGLNIDSRG
jgi:hypothetical protein